MTMKNKRYSNYYADYPMYLKGFFR